MQCMTEVFQVRLGHGEWAMAYACTGVMPGSHTANATIEGAIVWVHSFAAKGVCGDVLLVWVGHLLHDELMILSRACVTSIWPCGICLAAVDGSTNLLPAAAGCWMC